MTESVEKVARPWQPWERNFSGGRIGVQEQQGADANWIILHVESGVAKTTTSLRVGEAWELALLLSPQLKARFDELHQENRELRAAAYHYEWRAVDTDMLRSKADEIDCGADCEYSGGRCPRLDRDGCDLAAADSLRDIAKAIDVSNISTKADVLRAIDSCGGSCPADQSSDWSDGYDAALTAAEREVSRLFDKAIKGTSNGR